VSILIVPGKSAARFVRTGYVWHPIGIPSGFAFSSIPNAAAHPAAATNCRLEILAIEPLFPSMQGIVSRRVMKRRNVYKRNKRRTSFLMR
jgi:hypothetical protein